MGRNSSNPASAASITEISSKKVTHMSNASNVLTMERPVTRIALEACQYALEACHYPVEDTMSGGYSLDSGLASPWTVRIEDAATRAASFLAATVTVEPDLLAPYHGKPVTLSYYTGKDGAGKDMELSFEMVDGSTARDKAINIANSKTGLPIIIRCADTGSLIYKQYPVKGAKVASNRTAKVSNGATATVVKGDTAEQIAAKREAEQVKLDNRMNALQTEAELLNAKFDAKANVALQKRFAELAKNTAKALAAMRTAPEEGTENAAIFASLKKDIGATCKELNFEHDERNGNPYGTSNRGWKQIAQKLAPAFNHDLYQSVRVCNRTTSVNIVLTAAFKLVSKGEDAGAGWHNITPAK